MATVLVAVCYDNVVLFSLELYEDLRKHKQISVEYVTLQCGITACEVIRSIMIVSYSQNEGLYTLSRICRA